MIKVTELGYEAGIELPSYATEGSAGFDFQSRVNGRIEPGERKLFPTGLTFSFSPDIELQVRPRSGLALKHGITVLNAPGTVDSDYRDEVGVILYNAGNEPYNVNVGDRIAQGIFAPILRADDLQVSERSRTGGFGSTGTNKGGIINE